MFDAIGLDTLTADLTAAPGKAQWAARGIIDREARQVQDDARSFAPSGPHLPTYAASITYDIDHVGGGVIEAEIGPDKDLPQGALGNLVEFGSVHNAPFSHLGPALDLAGPRLEGSFKKLDDGL